MNTELLSLAGKGLAIAIEPVPAGPPLWRHFGARLADQGGWPLAGARPLPPNALDGDLAFSVLPTHGLGWFQQPALLGARAGDAVGDGSDWAQHFAVERTEQREGALTVVLRDEVAALGLTLHYAIDPATDVLTTWAELENRGTTDFRVDWLAAACVPLPPEAEQVIGFWGRWTLEFQQSRETLGVATWRRDSRRGRNAHDTFPGVIVGTTLADDEGPAWGAHLAWSGNHTMLIEPLNDGRRQLQLGEWLAPGEVLLAPGERYRTPDALLSFSAAGLNGLAANYHRHMRTNVLGWPDGRMAPRPVHLNTWEAVYFDHDLDGLKALASAGAEVGIERFVLDDGWFHGRHDDRSSLGDWWPDARKYPQGLAPLVEHVRGLRMQFGLWVEPEMVNPDSELYRAHPDWALQMAGRPLVTGRNQLVLDLSRDEVIEYLFGKLDGLLREVPIAYLKWDMNRDLATAATGAGHRGRAAYRRHTLALYGLLERLRQAHPRVEIESCSSGGARADAGILRYTQRVWTSDCNDALTRIGIQGGFLRFMPPEVMGAHIGPAHSHTTGRTQSLAFRAAVALFGHLGVEMDLRQLGTEERAELTQWIATYKAWRDLVHHGVIRQGSHHGRAWLQAHAEDGSAALVALYRRLEEAPRYTPPLRVAGLDAARRYRVQALHLPKVPHSTSSTGVIDALAAGTLEMSGAQLRDLGLPLPPLPPESAIVVALKEIR
ncbi:alpha-galactosidase [Piscinibacter sp.]|jgi:alpha-galactosidase|uniref:alpha-galactosidase n=1 Tax=Piscinibacter sp. TaxID=1903157 RepID=UPI00355A80EC